MLVNGGDGASVFPMPQCYLLVVIETNAARLTCKKYTMPQCYLLVVIEINAARLTCKKYTIPQCC